MKSPILNFNKICETVYGMHGKVHVQISAYSVKWFMTFFLKLSVVIPVEISKTSGTL